MLFCWVVLGRVCQPMRGTDHEAGELSSYASPEDMVRQDSPLRANQPLVKVALNRPSPAFEAIYVEGQQPP